MVSITKSREKQLWPEKLRHRDVQGHATVVASLTKLRKIEESSAVLATRNERITGCRMGCCLMKFLLYAIVENCTVSYEGKSPCAAWPAVSKRAVFSSPRLSETLG